jgi:hypothetical protein
MIDHPSPSDIAEGESQARSKLAAELPRQFALMNVAFELVAETLNVIGDVPTQAVKVCTALLSKLSTDLRVIVLVAERGYPTQAVTLASSLYETAFTIAYVGSDETLAQEWIDRAEKDPTRLFRPAWDLTVGAFRNLGVDDPESTAESYYLMYSQLCMGKHAHPGYILHHSIETVGDDVVIMNGPNTTDAAIRAIDFSLEGSAGLTYVALASFIGNHVPEEARDALKVKAEQMGRIRLELHGESRRRWGSTDPYPGQWRKDRRPPS